jgi:hypothetical protein
MDVLVVWTTDVRLVPRPAREAALTFWSSPSAWRHDEDHRQRETARADQGPQ